MTRPRVVVAGHLMLDIVVRPRGPIAPTSDTPSDVALARGGAGANIARAIQKVGAEVTYLASVGDDATGTLLLSQFDVPVTLHHSSYATGTLVALVAADGQRAMLTDAGANHDLPAEFLIGELTRLEPQWFHLSGYVLLNDSTREAGRRALDAARQRGIRTSTDACSVGPIETLGTKKFLDAIGHVDLFCCNEQEAEILGDGLHDVADERLITMGARGAQVHRGSESWDSPALPVHVVDTTGAGDAATGTYIAMRLQNESVTASLAAAMTAASEVISRLGAN